MRCILQNIIPLHCSEHFLESQFLYSKESQRPSIIQMSERQKIFYLLAKIKKKNLLFFILNLCCALKLLAFWFGDGKCSFVHDSFHPSFLVVDSLIKKISIIFRFSKKFLIIVVFLLVFVCGMMVCGI